ncbi:MAG: oxaloacetate decarboxylase [Alphaproteobacteria bacterium]|nr:oxaloacetate decarboxylase [Alphaproteobacteria bacterium]MCZ6496858.1 oxaloacetate decarboxylase [Alphaproteobacteria bacterium]
MAENLNSSFKERVARRDGLLVPGAANALAAKIIEDTGFEAIYVTGAGIANMHLGAPDIGLITLSELADHVGAMRDAVGLPLMVDADTGFGNALNTRRTIQVLERAGANAIQLEDQVFPKRCGHFAGKAVIPTDEMVGKIKAAVDARVNGDLMIVARTDARAPNGFEDAMERAERYIEAGADMTFVEAPLNKDELAAIARDLPVPQIVNMVAGGLTPLVGRAALAEMGFAFVLYANAALQAAIHAMQTVLGSLKENGSLDAVMGQIAGFEERQRAVAKPLYDALEQKYATDPDQGET